MDLSYEETMRRIEEYDRTSLIGYICCREQTYPYTVDIYRYKGQIVINPMVTCIGYYQISSAYYEELNSDIDPLSFGEAIKRAFDYIRSRPADARTRKECADDYFIKKVSSANSHSAFIRKYTGASIMLREDGSIKICGMLPEKREHLLVEVSVTEAEVTRPSFEPGEAGSAVLRCLDLTDELKRNIKEQYDEFPPCDIELPCGKTVIVQMPKNKNFTETFDYHAAEIYCSYTYYSKNSDREAAVFYLGMAAELDCDVSAENIRRSWEEADGKAELFEVKKRKRGIFNIRAEMKNSSVHRISYLLRTDEYELLECTAEIFSPGKNKSLDEMLAGLFEDFAKKCRYAE